MKRFTILLIIYVLVPSTIYAADNADPPPGGIVPPVDTWLHWDSTDGNAIYYAVFFGTDFDAVRNGMNPTLTTTHALYVGELLPETIYCWRVDEIIGLPHFRVFEGEIWSFTTDIRTYPVQDVIATASSRFQPTMGPENTINGSGLEAEDLHGISAIDMWLTHPSDTERWIQYEFNKAYKLHEMWVWNQNQGVEPFIGFGAREVTIEHSIDGENWTTLDGVPQFVQAPGAPNYAHNTVVDFKGATARYVKLTINDAYGTFPQVGLSEVRFFAIPVYARNPQPADGADVESVDVTLTWDAGREAATHELVLSSDRWAVEDGTAVVGAPTDSRFTLAGLAYGTEYF